MIRFRPWDIVVPFTPNWMTARSQMLVRMFSTCLRKTMRRSDYGRWGTNAHLSVDWDARTERIAKLVGPGSSVIEFGAGRLVLKKYLPAGCICVPSDIVYRGDVAIVCDLNSFKLPEFDKYDCAIFGGVLEYFNDVPRLISHLSKSVSEVIASYAISDTKTSGRRAQGWVNDFSDKQIIAIFKESGFDWDYAEKWREQVIYRFKKSKTCDRLVVYQ